MKTTVKIFLIIILFTRCGKIDSFSDLNKENKWFGIIELGGVPMTKDTFIECLEIL